MKGIPTAEGEELTQLGERFLDVERKEGEDDDSYRERCLDVVLDIP